MGFFGSSKPKVSGTEYRKHVQGALLSKGLSRHSLDVVNMVFDVALNGATDLTRGIDSHEIDRGVQFLRDHHGKYNIPLSQIDIVEEVLRKYIKSF